LRKPLAEAALDVAALLRFAFKIMCRNTIRAAVGAPPPDDPPLLADV